MVWALLTGPSALALDDGLYAVFHTSMGSFTSRLHYAEAPLTVANFVGLAEGSQTWLDKETGAVREEPFYDDTVFHRVIEGFVIQGGSRNQQGTDGPGYRFPDEIPNGWLHDGAGVLSMANAGYDSNGSQFFITVDATPWLDGNHTVFGQVISGLSVVEAINSVAVDADDKPVEDVTIYSIDILRIGADAVAFDSTGRLPVITEGRTTGISKVPDGLQLTFEPSAFHGYYLRSSTDLAIWSIEFLGTYADHAPAHDFIEVDDADLKDLEFYSLIDLDYPGNEYASASIDERIIEFEFHAPENLQGTRIRYAFGDENDNAVHINDEPSGEISDHLYVVRPYPNRALLLVVGTGIIRIDYRLDFSSATTGVFSGVVQFEPPESQAAGSFAILN